MCVEVVSSLMAVLACGRGSFWQGALAELVEILGPLRSLEQSLGEVCGDDGARGS